MLHGHAPRPASLIFTLYGDFVYGHGDKLWIARLVRLMAEFGLSEQAVRQAVSRMSRQGWLAPVREGKRAYYALTPKGAKRVEAIAPRIYEPAAEWDGRWRLLTYTIPETNRERRDRLRKDLVLLGLAPLSSSTWISPRDISAAMREIVTAHGVREHAHFFTADYAGPLGDAELLARSWDLRAIAKAYEDFNTFYAPRFEREHSTRMFSPEQAFAERLALVQDFRRFLYLDPGLPSALLPAHWPGSVASALFRKYYRLILSKATDFFERILPDGQ
ncbi:MAG: phenylacetic acid degradation operon negative regulatory protein PaaX [Candidatus Eremiobacteraeota bacterium]|nr:phenylacetic acid degradation operon negative regulatory protein PaaX [Candidatus Eremiobacteraeota bacterium]